MSASLAIFADDEPTIRQDPQPAFVLHSYPFRETSLVVEIFTRDLGRIAVVAKARAGPSRRCAACCWRSSRSSSRGRARASCTR